MDKIFSLFGLHKTAMIVTVASQVIKTFEQEFAKDGDAKSAALDALLNVLQQHKMLENITKTVQNNAPIPTSPPTITPS